MICQENVKTPYKTLVLITVIQCATIKMYVYIADSNKIKIVIFTEISKLSIHTFTSNIISPESLSIFKMSSFHLNTVTISIFFHIFTYLNLIIQF